jgi:metal-sulfur cluster biosynthetic enzyme
MMSEQPNTPATREEEVMEALRVVVDPEIGLNVVELGLVRRVDIHDDSAHVVMILTTPFCPYAPQLMEQVRFTAQKTLGVPTTIEMGTELWDPSYMEDDAIANWGLF